MDITAVVHTLVPVVAAMVLNGIIYGLGWNSEQNDNSMNNKYLPPGYVIAGVWVIILGLLGYTHYLVYPSYASAIIVLAVLYCLAYPFLTGGLRGDNADILNLISLVIAIAVILSVGMKDVRAIVYTIPFLLWTTYVNIATRVPL
jgi:tryptophan-rich sensory protein